MHHFGAGERGLGLSAAGLDALPQFTTEIDGLAVRFRHVRSPHPHALPLLITHGWPGSAAKLMEVIGPLIDPPAYGRSARDAVDLVLPRLPGDDVFGTPGVVGWDTDRMAAAWDELMRRLGYTVYGVARWSPSGSTQ